MAPDGWVACLTGVAASIVLICLRRFVNRAWPDAPLAVKVAAALVIFWGLVVGCALLAGSVGLLTPLTLVEFVTLASIGLAELTATAPGQSAGEEPSDAAGPSRTAGRALLLFIALALVVHTAVYGIHPLPIDWDSLAYHIPVVDGWVRYAHLYSRDCAQWFNPGNSELLAFWFVAPFSGDFWINLGNVPVIALLAAATYALSQVLKLSPVGRSAVTAVVLLSQPVLHQLVTSENDVAVAALSVAALLFAWRWLEGNRLHDLVLFAAATGLLAGIKYYALGYAAVVAAIPCCLLAARREFRRAGMSAGAAVLGFAALGAFWYARNWWLAGSPLYPKGVFGLPDLFNAIQPGNDRSSLATTNQGAVVWSLLLRAWSVQTGPASIAAIAAAVLMPVAVMSVHRNRSARFCSLALCGFAAVYLVTPNVVETEAGTLNMIRSEYHPVRFGLPLMAVSILAGGGALRIMFEQLRHVPGGRWAVRASQLLAAASIVGQGLWELGPLAGYSPLHARLGVSADWYYRGDDLHEHFLMLVLIAHVAVLFFRTIYARLPVRQWCGLAVALAVWCGSSVSLSHRWHREFDVFYARIFGTRMFDEVARHCDADARACVCDYRYYPYLGARRQGNVCEPLWVPEERVFNDYLDREGVTSVVAVIHDSPNGRYLHVYKWMSQNPHRFKLLAQDERLAFFQVRRQ